jgi:CRISPR/Cas system CSM-associated protein Csm3 (group 7 of RAMP superfamily)
MFAQQLNQIRVDLSVTPRGPLLVRSGKKGGGADPTRPELECVRTAWGGTSSVYVPGSSLKGVMRSHAERLLLSASVAVTPTFERSTSFNQKSPGPAVYAGSSPLGRTFGNLHLKGHLAVSDLLPGAHDPEGSEERARQVALANAVEQRNGVAIDRLLGSAVGGALFDQEVVVQGRFDGRVLLRNVQLYQLALLLLVVRDLDEGYVQIGSGTTRGNGWVHAEVRQIVIETRRGGGDPRQLRGVGLLHGDARTYGLFEGDEVALPEPLAARPHLVWDQVKVSSREAVETLAAALVDGPWTKFLAAARKGRWKA